MYMTLITYTMNLSAKCGRIVCNKLSLFSIRRNFKVELSSFANKNMRTLSSKYSVSVSKNYSIMSRKKKVNKKSVSRRKGNNLGLHYIFVQSSKDRWDDIPGGVLIDLGYYDSLPEINNNSNENEMNKSGSPVVVALHDSPGSHFDLFPLLKPFEKTGYRVLAPNFPGFGITYAVDRDADNIFSHTTDEKAELVIALLDNLDIKNVDLLIACGAATYPALRVATDNSNLKIKSIALINPWPHEMFRYLSRNSNVFNQVAKLWDNPASHIFVKPLLAMMKNKFNIHFDNTDEFVKYCYTVKSISFNEVGGNLITIDNSNIPRLVIYPDDSSFIEPEILAKYLKLQGINIEEKMIINSDGKIVHKGSDVLNKCVAIETDHHDVLPQYSSVINGLISNFMDSIKRSKLKL